MVMFLAAPRVQAAPSAVTEGKAVPATFADVQVVDPDNVARPLADAWRDRPALLIFLRHYG